MNNEKKETSKYVIISIIISLVNLVVCNFIDDNYNIYGETSNNYIAFFAIFPLQLILLATMWINRKMNYPIDNKLEKITLVSNKIGIYFVCVLLFNNLAVIAYNIIQYGYIDVDKILFNLVFTIISVIASLPLFYAYNLLARKIKIRYISLLTMILTFISFYIFLFSMYSEYEQIMFNQWYNIFLLPILTVRAFSFLVGTAITDIKFLSVDNFFFLFLVVFAYILLYNVFCKKENYS